MAYRAKDFIDAIPGTAGIISTLAEKVGCDWHTAKKYIDNFPTVSKAFEAEKEKLGDKAVSNIAVVISKAVTRPSEIDRRLQTSKWYLDRIRKDEFSTRTEVKAEVVDDLNALTPEERFERLQELLAGAKKKPQKRVTSSKASPPGTP